MELFRSNEEEQAYDSFLQKTREVFTPFGPVTTPEFFVGRLKQIEQLQNQLLSPGRQAALYGDRGVGKTSLASVMPFFLKLDASHVCYIRCTSDSRPEDLIKDILIKTGKGFRETSRSRRLEKHRKLEVKDIAAASRIYHEELNEASLADLRQIFNHHIETELKDKCRDYRDR